jgi:hypothetical protein
MARGMVPCRVGITAPGQAQNTIEKEPQTPSLRRICWDQSTVTLFQTNAKPQKPSSHEPSSNSNLRLTPALSLRL